MHQNHAQAADVQSLPQHAAERQWYIQVDQKNYGPFNDQTLWDFMCEGRVTANSLISQYPNTAYRAVSADPGLMTWIAQVPISGTTSPQNNHTTNLAQQSAKQSVFIIMAEIRSGRGMEFLQSLQNFGDVERIGDTVWLLQASASSEEIRDILCQPLAADDRLFILDSFANKSAWFNLGTQMDVRMRELWGVKR